MEGRNKGEKSQKTGREHDGPPTGREVCRPWRKLLRKRTTPKKKENEKIKNKKKHKHKKKKKKKKKNKKKKKKKKKKRKKKTVNRGKTDHRR